MAVSLKLACEERCLNEVGPLLLLGLLMAGRRTRCCEGLDLDADQQRWVIDTGSRCSGCRTPYHDAVLPKRKLSAGYFRSP
jgi:hypothetical protein